jgi:hypothetical protein
MSRHARLCAIALALSCTQPLHADAPAVANPATAVAAPRPGAPTALPPVAEAATPVAGVDRVPPATSPPARTPARGASALQLETTQITGNRELPKVMVIVPWKSAEPAELAGRPLNSLVEEVLTPVDRGVMRRTLDYYRLLAPGETPVTEVKQAAEIDTTDQ